MNHQSKLDDQLCFALYAATNAVTRAYRPLLHRIGLTYPQYLVLLVLWQDGDCTPGHIARRLDLAPNAITPLVDRLGAAGLVERARREDDRRVIHICLTVTGRELERKVSQVQGEVACRTGLSPEAVSALRNELQALVRQMAPARRSAGGVARDVPEEDPAD